LHILDVVDRVIKVELRGVVIRRQYHDQHLSGA
jgi:hypothetical protein